MTKLTGIALGLALVCASSARAGDLAAEAERHMAAGEQAMAVADFQTAIVHFKAAAVLAPESTGPHAMLGLAYAAANHCEDAIPELEIYMKLKQGNPAPTPLRALEDCRARLTSSSTPPPAVDTPPPPEVRPPSPAPPTTPAAPVAPIETRSFPPAPVPSAELRSSTISVQTLTPQSTTSRQEHHVSKTRLTVGCSLLGVGGAAAVTGAVLLGLGGRDGTSNDFATLDSFRSHVSAFQDAGIVLLAVGGAAVVGGVITLVLPRRAAQGASASIVPSADSLRGDGAL